VSLVEVPHDRAECSFISGTEVEVGEELLGVL
jgi:hypothetical protein